LSENQLEGLNWIDSTCEIHPTAKIGPNVMISPHCKIGEGVRLRNCILLPDAVIQPHSVVIHSIVGWTSVIGAWARIEGIIDYSDKPTILLNERMDQEYGIRAGVHSLNVNNSSLASAMAINVDSEGLYHRESEEISCHDSMRVLSDGITVIGAGVFVASEVHLRNCVVLPNV
jgi:NDP-sugar pyrophosphorylase family protein